MATDLARKHTDATLITTNHLETQFPMTVAAVKNKHHSGSLSILATCSPLVTNTSGNSTDSQSTLSIPPSKPHHIPTL